MFDSSNWLLKGLMTLVPLVLSLTVHEWAHAWSAYKLGDDTASREGRLTLNPIVHMDLFGTFLLPLLGMPFGWAKPVPVNPARFNRSVSMTAGMMITATAGPLSNVLLALACALAWGLAFRFQIHPMLTGAPAALLKTAMVLNLNLAIFNMIPIPPLDGSRIVDGLLPYRFRPQWEMVHRYSFIFLMLVFFFAQTILSIPMSLALAAILRLVEFVAGA